MASTEVKMIRKLPEDVVNKIAAGEVIQRPRNVVKELMENSIDAGSRVIQVSLKFQGTEVKMLQVKDDGCGIHRDSLSLACERFSTSKLVSTEDLHRMETFGFRGEALASISHVSRLEIITKQADSPIGFSLKYMDGNPTESTPKPVASNQGTTITVNDLFYNNPLRKTSLKSVHEEYNLIFEIVSLYSLNNLDIGFTLRKHGCEPDVKVEPTSDLIGRIKSVMGPKVGNNLKQFECSDSTFNYSCTGVVGDRNSLLKSFRFVFFINNRLVECSPLRKSLETLYKTHLAKGNCSFVMLSLTIVPANVDINVHPTKSEVRFLFEDDITGQIVCRIEELLIPPKVVSTDNENRMVQQTLDSSLTLTKATTTDPLPLANISMNSSLNSSFGDRSMMSKSEFVMRNNVSHNQPRIDQMFNRSNLQLSIGTNSFERVIKLNTVIQLRNEISQNVHRDLRKMVKESSLVGVPDVTNPSRPPVCYIQYETHLISVNLDMVTKDLFYQLYLKDFSNFGFLKLTHPLNIDTLLQFYLKFQNQETSSTVSASDQEDGNSNCKSQVDYNETIKKGRDLFLSRREMCLDYFSFDYTSDGTIISLPMIVDGYIPDWKKLPKFIHDLVTEVNWTQEKECFRTFGVAISSFYATTCKNGTNSVVRDFIFPHLKRRFRPAIHNMDHFTNITTVKTLYKVFHRC